MTGFRGTEHRLCAAEELLARAKLELRTELEGFLEAACVLRPVDGEGGTGPIEPDFTTFDVRDSGLVDELADLVLDIQEYFAELPGADHWLDRYLADRAARRAA